MQVYDFCIAWNWQYDIDFVEILASSCHAQGLSFLQVTPANLEAVLRSLEAHQLGFRAFFDRASDADERFNELVDWARVIADVRINRFPYTRRAWNKTEMHQKLTTAGLDAPYTITLPSFLDQPLIPRPELDRFGGRFAIKPACGGGGRGVIACATCWDQVLAARQEYPTDQYLLQAYVEPVQMGTRPAWFRVLYCAGAIFPCWWDTCTHVYTPLTAAELYHCSLDPLLDIPVTMAQVCQLELFSTEIAYTPQERFEIVDYINDPIDLRLQSRVAEGVPDGIVRAITNELTNYVAAHCRLIPVYV